MTIPPKLNPGDKVAITATSSPCTPEALHEGIKTLESLGLTVHTYESCYQTHGYLSGTDETRLQNLHAAFANPEIKAIFVARGGYGAARLLPFIDYNLIKNNPKPFIGFSDVTALHIAINQICNLVTYHGPMPASNLNSTTAPLTMQSLKHALFQTPAPIPAFPQIIGGNVIAPLTGGNLSLVAASLGTPFEIDTAGKILFLEEINEPPYKIDRLFLQLKQAGKLKAAVGIILGDFSPETPKTLEQSIQELIIPENKPTIINYPCGHTSPTLTLPMGATVSIHQPQTHVHFQK